jgi:GTP-binding protein HflX
LHEIGAGQVPQVLVFNKLDALAPSQRPRQMQDLFDLEGRSVPRLFVSARTGEGLPQLRQALAAQAAQRPGAAVARQSPDTQEAQA